MSTYFLKSCRQRQKCDNNMFNVTLVRTLINDKLYFKKVCLLSLQFVSGVFVDRKPLGCQKSFETVSYEKQQIKKQYFARDKSRRT